MWFIMAKRVKQGGFVSVLFVLALMITVTPAAWGAEFGLHYKSSSGQEGYATSPKNATTEVSGFLNSATVSRIYDAVTATFAPNFCNLNFRCFWFGLL